MGMELGESGLPPPGKESPMPSSPTLTPTVPDPIERLIVEQALAFARELRKAASDSPDGQALRNAETVCLTQGREFLRTALATVLQAEADGVEKKGSRPDAAPADPDATTKAATATKS